MNSGTSIELGPFRLHESIGKGAMGEVWRGEHLGQRVPVAVKVLSGEQVLSPQYWDAFRNEVQAVAGLNHPGIVVVLDYGEVSLRDSNAADGRLVEGSPYLVMELASGGSLEQLQMPLRWSATRKILLALLDALAHAHARGVIHRDIKPANVLISTAKDTRPGLKLTDFGIAHALEQERAGTTEKLMGTPQYMAPEQFEGRWRDYGPWTDLYALGCLAWELVAGQPPFEGMSIVHMAYQHLSAELPALSTSEELPPGFENWLRRLLKKRPGERFQRASDAAFALRQLSEVELPPTDTQPVLPIIRHPGGSEGHRVNTALILEDHAWALPSSGAATELDFGETLDSVDLPVLIGTGANPTEPKAPSTERIKRMTLAMPPVFEDDRDEDRPPIPADWRRETSPGPSMRLVGAGLGLFGLRAVPLVGRESERDTIWSALRRVDDREEARLLLLRGAAGVGKSRLVEWICQRAHELGAATILKATHSPTPGPSDGLSGLISRHLRCIGLLHKEAAGRVERMLSEQGISNDYEWRALTELIVPANDDERSVHWGSATQRYVLARRLIERLGASRPVVLWLDDVQWASDTLAFIEYVCDSPSSSFSPLLILMTARDEALAERPVERQHLDALTARPSAEVIDLAPLTPVVCGELVQEIIGLEGELAERLEARCGGNPLFAVQLVGDWVHRGVLEVTPRGFALKAGERAELPDDIHQVWTARITRLLEGYPTTTRTALELAAALGRDVDAASWRGACGVLKVSLSQDLLEALLDNRLLLPGEGGFRFAHEMLRESLARGAAERGVWQRLHRVCAQALEASQGGRPGVSERVGAHLLEAGALEAALEPLLQGCQDRQFIYQFKEAGLLLDRAEDALTRLEAAEDDPRWGEIWLTRVLLMRRQMRFDGAMEVAMHAEALARGRQMPQMLARALQAQGEIARQQGDLARAAALLEEARVGFEACLDTKGTAQVLAAVAAVTFQQGDLTQASVLLSRGHDLSVQAGDRRGAARSLLLLGHVARRQGELETAAGFYRRAHGAAEQMGNRLGMATTLNSLGEVERIRGSVQEAETYYRKALSIFEEIGHGESVFPRLNLSLLLLRRACFDEARSGLEEGLTVLTRRGQRGAQAGVQAALMACAAGMGDWEAWDTHSAQVEALLEATAIVERDVAWTAQRAAELAVEAGQIDRARGAYAVARAQWAAIGDSGRLSEVEAAVEVLA